MTPSTTPNITQLLVAWNQGDQEALVPLTPLVYRELHRLAHGYLANGAGMCCKPRRWSIRHSGG